MIQSQPMREVARDVARLANVDLATAEAAIEAATRHGDPDPLGDLIGFEAPDEWRDRLTGRYCAACLGPALAAFVERVLDE